MEAVLEALLVLDGLLELLDPPQAQRVTEVLRTATRTSANRMQ